MKIPVYVPKELEEPLREEAAEAGALPAVRAIPPPRAPGRPAEGRLRGVHRAGREPDRPLAVGRLYRAGWIAGLRPDPGILEGPELVMNSPVSNLLRREGVRSGWRPRRRAGRRLAWCRRSKGLPQDSCLRDPDSPLRDAKCTIGV